MRGSLIVMLVALVALAGCSRDDGVDTRVYIEGTRTPPPTVEQRRAADVDAIYAEAAAKDERGLLDRAQRGARERGSLDPAVMVGLLAIDRTKYASAFVEAYPVTRTGVVDEYGRHLAAAHLTADGAAFPIDVLAERAHNGDVLAAQKLTTAFALAEGSPLAPTYAKAVRQLARARPDIALAALARTPVAPQLAALSNHGWCGSAPPAFTEPVPASSANPSPLAVADLDAQRSIAEKLRTNVAVMCATPRPVRRTHRPHRHAQKTTSGKKPTDRR